MTLTLIIVAFAQDIAVRELRDRVGSNLQEVSLQMRDKIEMVLEERYRDLLGLSGVLALDAGKGEYAHVRSMLDSLQATYDKFAWLGLAGVDGRVLVSSGGVLAGASVADRPWFRAGLEGPYLGDVHDAQMLAEILASAGAAPLRLIDVAVPVYSSVSGEQIGVLGAHLYWSWIQEIERGIIVPLESRLGAELLVVSIDRQVLLGPPGTVGTTLDTNAARAALSGETGHMVETWPDGERYLVGYSQTRDHAQYEGLKWAVLLRKPARSAFEPANHIRNGIIVAGLLSALVFCMLAWLAAQRVSRPLLDMTHEAEAINEGRRDARISPRDDFDEVNVLSRAMNRLIQGLKGQEQELRLLNTTLEDRVAARTEDLELANKSLRDEIAMRERLRAERERMIRQLQELANTDALTGISNRRHFFDEGERLLKRVTRRDTGAALILFDVDHFKRINDAHGHGVGDEALRHIVARAQDTIREVDLIARVGGEEFAILLEDEEGGNVRDIAERLRALVATSPLVLPGQVDGVSGQAKTISMTVSLGVARLRDCPGPDLDILLACADRALYEAKASGRNRVCSYHPEPA
ncbi:sensor domain-containing diguanylate cyclase [Marinobacter bohaiensis]|uniref:sensor domain-containing diguanylate cyclase n=1 Tax=Marinobacter bohaiensis TaxID=2201898 RepID=UPI0013A6D5AA|nr:diguanylate cyclase [Marinobacter bohaiensis]